MIFNNDEVWYVLVFECFSHFAAGDVDISELFAIFLFIAILALGAGMVFNPTLQNLFN